ncbi:MAG: DUF1800 domain-containing protein [Gemmatimonadota bacterium]
MTTRRRFLGATGALAAAAAVEGCADGRGLLALWETDDAPPFTPPTEASIDAVSHAIARLTHGARPSDYARVRALAPTAGEAAQRFIDEQLTAPRHDDSADRAVRRLEALAEPVGELYEYQPDLLRDQLVSATLLRAVHADRQLHDVMTGVWADHFNVDISKGDCRWLTPAFVRDVLRPNALGTFPALLRDVVLSPAMLWYLDGRVNRCASPGERPNENYARELLELHTLGVHAGYSQNDVMEVARALTGWTVRSRHESHFGIGRVEFHAEAHDDGEKVVLGQRIAAGGGARDVDALLTIVTAHPACARFIAGKLCRHFIDDAPPAGAVDAVARTFAATGGDIAPTLRTLFGTTDFRAARSSRLKRPFHFVASALRATDARTDGGRPMIAWLERLGQLPFQFPTPDGYPDEAAPWLGTLLWRWQFAAALAEGRIVGTTVDVAALVRRAGGERALFSHLLGRAPSTAEVDAARVSRRTLALALSSPAFQLT